MEEKEFNLLNEPWIRVLTGDMEIKELSLIDTLSMAPDIQILAGESEPQNAALLRLLLAITETIFYRYDENGEEVLLSEEDFHDHNDVFERWKAYYDKGYFPKDLIEKYLLPFEEKFYLFHPETPFYQMPEIKGGTIYKISSMNGRVKASGNKKTKHHFSLEDDDRLSFLTYKEAARWLVHYMNFCPNVKPDKKNVPGDKVANGRGQMGKMGFVMIAGKNLFETILFNLCPLKDGKNELWDAPNPVWENVVSDVQSLIIPIPDNIPEMYTIHSKNILLRRENGVVVEYQVYSGLWYGKQEKDNKKDVVNVNEPMTLWKCNYKKKTKQLVIEPLRHSAKRSFWRDFNSVIIENEENKIPSLITWYKQLLERKYIDNNNFLSVRAIGMEYDKQGYTYYGEIDDNLSLVSSVINEKSNVWQQLIKDEIEKSIHTANTLNTFAKNVIKLIENNDSESGKDLLMKKSGRVSDEFYNNIDAEFRSWIYGLNNTCVDKDKAMMHWERYAYYKARETAERFMEKNRNNFFTIRKEYMGVSIPKLYKDFLKKLNKTYPKTREVIYD